MNFENQLELGLGIYTPTEIARILRIPSRKVHWWIKRYWDGELGKRYEARYSWKTNNSKAVSFHKLIEFYVMMELSEQGVKTRPLLEAHKILSDRYKSPFPFAKKEVLQNIRTDGKRIYFVVDEASILALDGSGQLNLSFIEVFFKNIDLDTENLAFRYWPLGRCNSILIDPERKFGHPLIANRNIAPEIIYNHIKSGDPVNYIAHVYNLTEKQVDDALEYCNAA